MGTAMKIASYAKNIVKVTTRRFSGQTSSNAMKDSDDRPKNEPIWPKTYSKENEKFSVTCRKV